MREDLVDFMTNEKSVPTKLDKSTREILRISLNSKHTLIKFILSMLLGLMMSLFLCPQYGISFNEGHQEFTNFIMELGPTICGAYCGAIFFSGGSLMSLIILNRSEIWWIHRNRFRLFLPLAALVMWVSMYFGGTTVDHHDSSVLYNISWFISATSIPIVFYKIALKIKSFHFLHN